MGMKGTTIGLLRDDEPGIPYPYLRGFFWSSARTGAPSRS
jgi:hypothetical protein